MMTTIHPQVSVGFSDTKPLIQNVPANFPTRNSNFTENTSSRENNSSSFDISRIFSVNTDNHQDNQGAKFTGENPTTPPFVSPPVSASPSPTEYYSASSSPTGDYNRQAYNQGYNQQYQPQQDDLFYIPPQNGYQFDNTHQDDDMFTFSTSRQGNYQQSGFQQSISQQSNFHQNNFQYNNYLQSSPQQDNYQRSNPQQNNPVSPINSNFNTNSNTNTKIPDRSSLFLPPKYHIAPPTPLFPVGKTSTNGPNYSLMSNYNPNTSYNTSSYNSSYNNNSTREYKPLDSDDELDDVNDLEFCEQQYNINVVHCNKVTIHNRNLNKDLIKYGYSDDINRKANEIFIAIGCPTRRKSKRLLLLYGCLYFAHKENNADFTPESLANKIGINVKLEGQAISMIRKAGYTKTFEDKGSFDYMICFLNSSSLGALFRNEIYELYEKVDPIIGKSYMPQEIAMGVIKYFIMVKKINLLSSDPIYNTEVNSKKVTEIIDKIVKIDV